MFDLNRIGLEAFDLLDQFFFCWGWGKNRVLTGVNAC